MTPEELQQENEALKMELEKVYEIISFQLGSPLNTMEALSGMLMQTAESMDKEQVMEFNSHLHTQIAKVKGLLGNMIQWADLQVDNYQLNRQSFDATELLERIYAEEEPHALLKRQDYRLAITGNLNIWADPEKLGRILSNLISNAIKFTPTDGVVTIEVKAYEMLVEFSIIDQGIGMGNAKLRKLFHPGRKSTQRGTANEQGLGMGLIVAQKLLDLHGSDLNLESKRGKGTTATFTLPTQAPNE